MSDDKTVPREPTEAMLDAVIKTRDRKPSRSTLRAYWREMVDAAPATRPPVASDIGDIAKRNAGEPTLTVYHDSEWAILGAHDLAYEEGVVASISLAAIKSALPIPVRSDISTRLFAVIGEYRDDWSPEAVVALQGLADELYDQPPPPPVAVPREPTGEMIKAGRAANAHWASFDQAFADIWRAMHDAAPRSALPVVGDEEMQNVGGVAVTPDDKRAALYFLPQSRCKTRREALAVLLALTRAKQVQECAKVVEALPFPHGGEHEPNFDGTKLAAAEAIRVLAFRPDAQKSAGEQP